MYLFDGRRIRKSWPVAHIATQVSRDPYAWSVESSPNDIIIIHTHNEVIVAFQHGSQL
jgi:hypothetical protein